VRGRKKSDLSTSLMNFNTSQSTGESIGESPPRGTDDTAESDSSSVASSLEKLQDDFSMFPELWYVYLFFNIFVILENAVCKDKGTFCD
jgi:hypothetical protein